MIVWTLKAEATQTGHGWISSATSTALNHLRACALVSSLVKSTAEESCAGKYASNSPTASRQRRQASQMSEFGATMPSISFTAPGASSMAAPSMLPNNLSFPQNYSEWGGSMAPSLRNSPAPSDTGSSYSNPHAPSQSASVSAQSRSASVSAQYRRQSNSSAMIDPTLIWSPEKQKSFDTRIARMTASAGFPLSWVDNAEWIDFCTEFVPAAKLPSRKTLTGRLLPAAITELRTAAMTVAKGQNATLQADGWTGMNNHHLLAFMITVNGKVCGR